MVAWMTFVFVLTLLCGISALAADRVFLALKWSTRWIFLVAIVLPVALTSLTQWATPASTSETLQSLGLVTQSNELRTLAEVPGEWLVEQLSYSPANDLMDTVLLTLWLCSSLAMTTHLILSWASLRRRLSNAQVGSIDNTRVLMTPDIGPAVAGLMRPQICMPFWLNKLTDKTREIALAHEREHFLAGDTKLYGFSLLLLTAMPWNLALWWLHHRLRLAIEIDCDRRVLQQGYTLSQYGESLLEIASQCGPRQLVAAGLHASASSLEHRMRVMCASRGKARRSALALFATASISTLAFAATIDPPRQTLSAVFVADRQSTLLPIPSPVAVVLDNHDALAIALLHYFPELATARTEDRTIVWLLINEHGAVVRKAKQSVPAWSTLDVSDAAWMKHRKAFGVDESEITQQIVLESNLGANRVAVAWMVKPGAEGAYPGPVIHLPGGRASTEAKVVNAVLAHRAAIEHFDPKAISEGTQPGTELWFVMDANGNVLRSGRRQTISDPEQARHDIQTRMRGVRVAYVSRGTAVKNARGERIQVSWHWLEGDSPLPQDDVI